MGKIRKGTLLMLLFLGAGSGVAADDSLDASRLFAKKCSLCHAMDEKKLGPAVNAMEPDPEVLRQVITKGRNAMPAFEGKLSDIEIDALVDYLLKNI